MATISAPDAPRGPAFSAGAATLAVVAAAAMFGTLPFFARTLQAEGMAPPAIAFFRFALTAIVLLPLLRPRRATLWGLAGGVGMGLGWIGFVESLAVMSVAEAGVLFMTYPFFAILLGALAFGERLSAKGVLAAAMILGAAALATPLGDGARPGLVGAVLFALAAPAAYGLLINIIAHRVNVLAPLAAVGTIALGAVLGLLPLMLTLTPVEVVPQSAYGLLVLAAFSLVTALLPQLLMTTFAPVIGATRTAIAGSAELIAMFLVGVAAFGEALGGRHIAAGALVIAAIVVAAGRAKGAASRPPRSR